jgi:hypothetical protein
MLGYTLRLRSVESDRCNSSGAISFANDPTLFSPPIINFGDGNTGHDHADIAGSLWFICD